MQDKYTFIHKLCDDYVIQQWFKGTLTEYISIWKLEQKYKGNKVKHY